jgi:hypothetical protein
MLFCGRMRAKLPIVMWTDESGVTAECPAIPGSQVRCATIEGAVAALQEQLDRRLANGQKLQPARILFVELEVGEPGEREGAPSRRAA